MRDTGFSAQQVQTGLECIRELAQEPRTRFSTKDMVAEWFDAIEAALEKHSYAVIAQRLEERAGLSIAPGTLKNNYLKLKQERSGPKRGTKSSRKRTRPKPNPELRLDESQHSSAETTAASEAPAKNVRSPVKKPLPVSNDEITLAY